ncbi:hypothetical protein JL722_186 [Aureococcus anophagefferens]|nr:hypothetical protein JL722_186 [Aureococcus anophagefferens]
MKDIIPSWLEDPSAYAQPANLDMSTVIVVALTNLRRSAQDVPAGAPRARREARALSWVRPLMRLGEDDILRYGGYDVLIYLRFMSLSLKIFGSFAPYAFIVLLPVNASVSYWPGRTSSDDDDGATSSKDNTFNRLSMSAMPVHDKRMWAHCVGCFLLTFLSMHFLARECRWYTRLRHRFLTQRDDVRQRTILVRQVPGSCGPPTRSPPTSRSSTRQGRRRGGMRKVAHLDGLLVAREAAAARLDRVTHRRALAKAREGEYPKRDRGSSARSTTRRSSAPSTSASRASGGARRSRTRSSASPDGRRAQTADSYQEAAPPDDDREVAAPSLGDALCGAADVDLGDDDGGGGGGGVMYDEWSDGADLSFSDKLLVGFGLKRERDVVERAGLLDGASGPPIKEGEAGGRRATLYDTGFVTFRAFTGAAVATQVFHAATPGGMVASMAPEPRDVFWKNAELSGKQRTTRRVVADCLVVLLLIFYIIPVTLISLVFSEQALKAHWPALKELASDSLAFDACVKMVQPMALIALMLLLPPAFLGLGFWEGTLSWSENTLTQLSRYYSFQITNVLLVTTIAGSLVKCLQKIIDDPQATLSLLGESLPQVCAFFSCYIFIKVFSGLCIELCRAVAAVQQALKRCLYPSSTPRDQRAEVLGLRDFENPGWFSYGKYGAQDLLVVVLLMTYCVMSPIILVPGLLFFGWASVVYRHQLLYVYEPIFESGGLLWPRIYRRTLFSIFIMQLTMVGLFFLKHAFSQGYCVLALSVLTYLYKMQMRSMYTTSSSVAHHLPMELATAVDEQISEDAEADANAMLDAGLHGCLQPSLRADKATE